MSCWGVGTAWERGDWDDGQVGGGSMQVEMRRLSGQMCLARKCMCYTNSSSTELTRSVLFFPFSRNYPLLTSGREITVVPCHGTEGKRVAKRGQNV